MASADITELASIFDFLAQALQASFSDDSPAFEEIEEPGVSICRVEYGGASFMRLKYDIDIPFSTAIVLGRPDVWYNSGRPEYEKHLAECAVEEVLSPWDGICTFRFNFSNEIQRYASLMGAPKDYAAAAALDGGHVATVSYRAQVAVRRDMPQQGQYTFMQAPLNPETQEPCAEWGIVRARATVFELHEDSGRTQIIELRHCRGVPNWALTRLPDWTLGLGTGYPMKAYEWIKSYIASPIFREAAEGAMSFVVLGLKKCARGMPLLPLEEKCEGRFTWEPVPPEIVTLVDYVRAFLHRLGADEEQVYGNFEGRRLANFQAVMRLGAWERVWLVMEEPFLQQKVAYRRHFGGTIAPVFKVGVDPRFVEPAWASGVPAYGMRAPVRDTFVHFDTSSSPDRGRSMSDLGLPPGLELTTRQV